jgi:hypothetical protein
MDKLNQGKLSVLNILEVLNAKYAGEIKKDQEKKAKFLYSKFSPFSECIKQSDEVPLKIILSLV